MEKTKLLILRLTDRCNLSCEYCYAASEETMDMSLETAKAAIDLFAEPGEKLKIQFTGGEPLLCTQRIKEIAQYGKEQGIQMAFSIQTNGTLLDRERCALLKELRCSVGVSMDGLGEANSLRCFPDGSNSTDAVIRGLRNLQYFGMGCNLNAVVTNINQNRLSELLDLAVLVPAVKGLGLDMFRPMGRGAQEDYSPHLDSLEQDLLHLLKRQEKLQTLGVKVRIKELEKVRQMLQYHIKRDCYCYAESGHSAAVDPRGDLYPCASLVGKKELRMGNVHGGTVLVPKLPSMNAQCLSCPDKDLCMGGCPAGRIACGGCNPADCRMHQIMIQVGRREMHA